MESLDRDDQAAGVGKRVASAEIKRIGFLRQLELRIMNKEIHGFGGFCLSCRGYPPNRRYRFVPVNRRLIICL
jgi:hypothetical protein